MARRRLRLDDEPDTAVDSVEDNQYMKEEES